MWCIPDNSKTWFRRIRCIPTKMHPTQAAWRSTKPGYIGHGLKNCMNGSRLERAAHWELYGTMYVERGAQQNIRVYMTHL